MTTVLIIVIFVLGYFAIATEHKLQVNKSATALFLGITLWVIYAANPTEYIFGHHAETFDRFLSENPSYLSLSLGEQISKFIVEFSMLEHVGEIAEIILFLMGAMTIVEIIDMHGGFNFVNSRLKTRNSKRLLWMVAGITFFLSAVLDNLTTAIVMIMVLRKIIGDKEKRLLFAGCIVFAANSGGAFSPIGDVTTIMLWIKGNVTTGAVIGSLFLPSLISTIVPTWLLSLRLSGNIEAPTNLEKVHHAIYITRIERIIIFGLGVGGLIFVPFFRSMTGLPPFIGILGVLSVLWLYTEILYRKKHDMEESIKHRVSKVIMHIDMATILFFFGILMAVAVLQETGLLSSLADYFDNTFGNVYIVTGLIGVLSSIVDNVPLVAGAIGMYPVATEAMVQASANPEYLAMFVQDGAFWELLAYCAGVGGSLLIIGSAAGVVVMGLEKIDFGWYLKNISWVVLAGYLCGIGCYYLQTLLF